MTYYPGAPVIEQFLGGCGRLATWWINVRLRRWFSITVPTSALRVSNKLASACTSTCSLTEPAFKATSRFGLPAHLRDDAGLHLFAEAVLTHFQLIRPHGEVGDHETAVGAAEDAARQTRGVSVAFTTAPATGNAVWSRRVALISDAEMACA
jgi:hypothetical protein